MKSCLQDRPILKQTSSSRSCSNSDGRNSGSFKKRSWITLTCSLMQLFFQIMGLMISFFSGLQRERRSSSTLAQNGHTDPGECRTRMGGEKRWVCSRILATDQRVKNAVFMGGDNCWIMSHSKTHLKHEETEMRGLEPKPASLWWTGTHASEMMEDILISTRTGQHRIQF